MKKERELPKIFELEYLANEDLSENDLYYLFETKSLFFSLIQEMYRTNGEFTNINKIIHDIKHDNGWLSKRHFKTKNHRDRFVKLATNVIKNVYQYSDYMAKRWVDDFMFHYGFTLYHRN